MIDDAKTHPLCLLCVCLWKSHELSVDYMLHTRDTAAVVRFFFFFPKLGFCSLFHGGQWELMKSPWEVFDDVMAKGKCQCIHRTHKHILYTLSHKHTHTHIQTQTQTHTLS